MRAIRNFVPGSVSTDGDCEEPAICSLLLAGRCERPVANTGERLDTQLRDVLLRAVRALACSASARSPPRARADTRVAGRHWPSVRSFRLPFGVILYQPAAA